ncbi:MAG: NAD(P)H-binding protein [Psychromonas sp.]|nr:NAD(P)H-binding protein [Alteromonadales bacterium]MCP5076847.1 NAD(P)H-binding protein [Psychromonas sp.]
MKNIAVVGASGMLGKPVVKALLAEGFTVTVIGRELNRLKAIFTENNVIHRQADVLSTRSLKQALLDVDAVHINLAGNSPKSCYENQVEGTRNILYVAKELAIKRITYLSGTTSIKENSWHYDTDAKLKAEQLIKQSQIEYLIFCPSWFMETMPLFVDKGRATVFGKTTQPIRWIAASDYAQMVATSYQQDKVLNQRLYIHGPQAIDMYTALQAYCKKNSTIKLGRMPYWFGNLIAKITKDPMIKDAVALLKYYEIVGEQGDPTVADNCFGKPQITIEQWVKSC